MSTTMYSVRCLILALLALNIFFFGTADENKYLQAFLATLSALLSFIGSKNDLHFSFRFLSIIRFRQALLVSYFS